MTDADRARGERHNARRFIWANGLQGVGDQLVNAKTVLPWLLQAAGAPGLFTALLVPVRESGSMLPQAALTPWVTHHRSRKRIWLLGSAGQAVTATLIALSALFLRGWTLGAAVVVLLAALAVFRSLCSLAGKDVMGRTLRKGTRGRITGRAAALAGGVALVFGLLLSLVQGSLPDWTLAGLIGLGALGWFLSTAVFAAIDEPVPDEYPQGLNTRWWSDTWTLFTGDAQFRAFVVVRSLLLVSALSTTFVVTLSQEIGHDLTGIGLFVVASSLASLVGGRISGAWSDLSSRNVMAGGSAVASAAILAVVAVAHFAPDTVGAWGLPLGFFLIQLAHTAVRVGRKTYLVDLAEGDRRTRYTGAANTMMGVILLLMGLVSGLIALAGSTAALLFLAATGFVGVLAAGRMRDVSATS